jgi:glycolate oxidase FAD binding subunit
MASAAGTRGVVSLGGSFSKQRMARGTAVPGVTISTCAMRRVLQYEPRDLTISVEAGLPFAELSRLLAGNKQMVPLDPPCFDRATVGGVIATNGSGPRRRLYGTARDMVIGMSFAKLDGKLAKTGGMVVKNVAGFDMAKLMIGSFGTLAAMSVVNFKVTPLPPETRTFLLQFDSAEAAMAMRDEILRGVLQPAAVDALNPAAARRVGVEGFALLIEAGGSGRVLDRYARELKGATRIDGDRERELWAAIREFTPAFADRHPDAQVARISTTLTGTAAVLGSTTSPVVSRAGSGVSWVHLDGTEAAAEWRARPEAARWRYVFEYGEPASNQTDQSDFEVMTAIKNLFDPERILNPGRLYGRI